MAAKINFAAGSVLVLVILAGAILGNTDAATYVVGDSMGWRIPTSASAYSTWASQHTFHVGDILVFNFPTGIHDVAIVPKASYDGCISSSPISLVTVGPASINLTSPGQAYFICTFAQHCSSGQKLSIDVTSGTPSTPTPSPGGAPAPKSTPPPSPTPVPPPPASTPPPTPAPPTSAPTPATTPTTPAPSTSPPTPGGPATAPAGVPVPSSSPAPGPGGAAPPTGAPAPGAGLAPNPGASTPSETPSENVSPPPPSNSPPGTATATATILVVLLSFVIVIMC